MNLLRLPPQGLVLCNSLPLGRSFPWIPIPFFFHFKSSPYFRSFSFSISLRTIERSIHRIPFPSHQFLSLTHVLPFLHHSPSSFKLQLDYCGLWRSGIYSLNSFKALFLFTLGYFRIGIWRRCEEISTCLPTLISKFLWQRQKLCSLKLQNL